MQLKDQAAIVTGGASGLGAATARRLAAQGAKVAVCDLNEKLAETVAAEIGGVAVVCDVSDAASAEAAIAKAAAADDASVCAAFRERFQKLMAGATGTSNRITRAILLDAPLSIDRGEVTDKGSINQRAVLEHRSALVQELYAATPSSRVITLGQTG